MKSKELGATFQIPKHEMQVDIYLADGNRISGKLFLPILSSSPSGFLPLLEVMNSSTDFFPFLPDSSNETELINKNLVVQVVVDVQPDEIANLMAEAINIETNWVEQVEVACEKLEVIVGSVFLELPADRARVLDFLNKPTRFFSVKNEKKDHIINKKFVTKVRELSSLSLPKLDSAKTPKKETEPKRRISKSAKTK
ncbi:MAG: hypothetical protein JNN15_07065 [Blastocatellia bacterium]|nr:hypothetical protein [Blastocatellia bacterium]